MTAIPALHTLYHQLDELACLDPDAVRVIAGLVRHARDQALALEDVKGLASARERRRLLAHKIVRPVS